MKTFMLLVLALLNSAFDLSNMAQEKCSIKQDTPCEMSEDGSYTFRRLNALDAETALKAQMSAYQELRSKLQKNPLLKISFVASPLPESYPDLIHKRIQEKLHGAKSEEIAILHQFEHTPNAAVGTVLALPDPLRELLLEAIPFSRYRTTDANYTEHVFSQLRAEFPHELGPDEVLSERQKNLLIQHGALAILIAQGLAKDVHALTETKK